MGIMKLFSGKDPEEYEKKGDTLFEAKQYGPAKMQYETALSKFEKRRSGITEIKHRLEKKIIQSREALALQHKQTGEELIEAEMYEDAKEIFRLALDLTEHPGLRGELGQRLEGIENRGVGVVKEFADRDLQSEKTEQQDSPEPGDDHFSVLCGSLPEETQKAYQDYGDIFREGYVALNQGDFERAAANLSQAMEEYPSPESLIPLELATAYLNLEKYELARVLLEAFVEGHPDMLQGYYLLCEALWGMHAFDRAEKLLLACPQELADSLPVQLLRGESLFRAQRYREAESLYRAYLRSSGWEVNIAESLARTLEAIGEKEKARDLYDEIMSECRGCGARIDPLIKERFAELCFELGDSSTPILELYLSLVHEDPENRSRYYCRIKEIYSTQGNEEEARRYQLFSDRLENDAG